MSSCNCVFTLKDTDLPPFNRTEANFWRMKFLEAVIEVQKANKGAARLRRKLARLKQPRMETPAAPPKWVNYGSLSNGRCAFAKVLTGAACCLPEGHAGEHMTDQDRATANRGESL